MGSLSNTILKGHNNFNGKTTIMGNINAKKFNYSSINTVYTTSSSYAEKIQLNNQTAQYNQHILCALSNNGNTNFVIHPSVYATSANVIYAAGFCGTATTASKLNNQYITYYLHTSNTEKWWRNSYVPRSIGLSGTLSNSGTYSMHTSTATVATSTTIKKGDYIFGENGAIATVTAVNASTVSIRVTWRSCGEWTCLEKGTLITMADGSQKPIEDVQYGEMIMGYDFEKNEPTPAVAMISDATVKSENNSYYLFSNGEYLNCTDDHEIYNADKQCPVFARDLKEGDTCIGSNGEIIRVQAIHRYIGELGMKQFYQIISSNNTYFANNILNSMAPINKYNWLLRKFGEYIPEEILDILKDDSVEFSCYDFLAKNKEFRQKSVNVMRELKIRNNKIRKLKSYLNDTDYIVIKKSEGKEVSQEIINKRKEARDEINLLEDEINNIYTPMHDKLLSEYSEIGDDILLPHEKKRSKYFLRSCKICNEKLDLFKKHFGK